MQHRRLSELAHRCFGLDVVEHKSDLAAGHINASSVLRTTSGDVVLQRMNTVVLPNVEAIMANAEKIGECLDRQNVPRAEFLRTVDGAWLAQVDGETWRCYRYLEGSSTPPICTPEEAQATARAFGRYAAAIHDLELIEHVKGFHDFDRRVSDLESAIRRDPADRAHAAEPVTEQLLAVIDRVRLSSGFDAWREVPTRNVHNDAKGPNCIVGSHGARTIIDLDTTMPGTVLSDIGELVRSSTRDLPGASPEQLMGQIEAVNRGFFAAFGFAMHESERHAMLLAGPLLALENAARFLTDHLEGDGYYGAGTPTQNRDRAQVQMGLAQRLIDSIEWATLG